MNAGKPWLRHVYFDLARHDGEGEGGDGGAGDGGTGTGEGGEGGGNAGGDDGKDWKAEAEKFKAIARKQEERAKANADKAKKYDDVEASNKTEAEKLTAAAAAAEKRAEAATARAVRAEVKALAADQFADPADAAAFLDLSTYVGDDGEVDSDAIEADLAALLTKKPHLKKTTPTTPKLKKDPGQGAGNGDAAPVDFRKADKDAFAAEAAKYGIRPRS